MGGRIILKCTGFEVSAATPLNIRFFWNATQRQRVTDSDVSKQPSVLNLRSHNVRSLLGHFQFLSSVY